MVEFAQLREIVKERLEQDRSIQSVEAVAPTLEMAVSDAAALLDVAVRHLEYEILEKGSSGFWGMGRKDWRIRAYELFSRKKKKHSDSAFFVEDEAELAVIEDRNGEAFVHLRSGGEALLKITAPTGNGRKATEVYAIQLLAERNVTDIDLSMVSKTVEEALGAYIKVGNFDQHSYNDSIVRVEISDTEMLAFMQVAAPGANGADISYDAYIAAMKQSMVVHGVKEDFLRNFVDQPVYGERIEIAEGTKPVNGMHAFIQYNFETDQSAARLREGSNGRIDFKELNIIQNVFKGQPLAKKLPPEKGTPGKTVTGKSIPAEDGKDISMPVGEHVHVENDTIISDINGRVVMNNGLISVEPVYTVDGDVNLKTGNIDFQGTVIVNGDVEDGFAIKAAGNIEINGTVAKSNLEAEGDIIIRQGINAKGEGRIHAGKSVWARFIQNANVISGDMVVAADGIINSQVDAANRIICNGKRAAIMGGRLRASEEINTKILGNSTSGTDTTCEVGFDPKGKEELNRLLAEKEITSKLLEETKLNIQTLMNIKEHRKSLPEDKEAYLQELMNNRNNLITDLKKADESIRKVQDYLSSLKALGKVSASAKVYPGVKIIIRDVRDEVRAEYRAVTFVLENGLIRISKYEEPDASVKKGPDGYTTD